MEQAEQVLPMQAGELGVEGDSGAGPWLTSRRTTTPKQEGHSMFRDSHLPQPRDQMTRAVHSIKAEPRSSWEVKLAQQSKA